ncbi:hypothetical protein L7F22_037592 [Adiantum nelumboides]|nr:hypothetical protein [Adiantum nelumboides]
MTDDMAVANTIEELGDIREQLEVEVPPMTDDVDAVESADGMEEVGDTREQPKVEVSPMTDNVVGAEPAERIQEVGVTKEEQELGVSPITKHMAKEKSTDSQHPVNPIVQQKPEHSNQLEMEHEKKDTTNEQEHQNEEEEEDQQSTVEEIAFDKSPQLHGESRLTFELVISMVWGPCLSWAAYTCSCRKGVAMFLATASDFGVV